MINKIKEKLKWAFTTKIGLVLVAVIWLVLFSVIHKITDTTWSVNLAGIGAIAVGSVVVIMVLLGWVINPIRSLINKIKNKK